MTSGVYQLTFSSGDTYIGKSINIEERWKQHYNKFTKGTAAKNMQAAYNRYGAPNGHILVKCHEDHIDVVEACYINRNKPTLNSDRPKDPFPDLTGEQCDHLFSTFIHSARDLVAMKQEQENTARKKQNSLNQNISELELEIECLKEENLVLTEEADRLLKQRSEEEIQKDISKRILTLEFKNASHQAHINQQVNSIKSYTEEIQRLQEKLQYERLPWWKKLFK